MRCATPPQLARGFAPAHARPCFPGSAPSPRVAPDRHAHAPWSGRLDVSETNIIGSLRFHRAHTYISQALSTSLPLPHPPASPPPFSPLLELQIERSPKCRASAMSAPSPSSTAAPTSFGLHLLVSSIHLDLLLLSLISVVSPCSRSTGIAEHLHQVRRHSELDRRLHSSLRPNR